MSLRAELVRVWLRWAMKRSNHPNVTIPERRRRMTQFERRVPRPPGWIEMSERPLGGIPALHVRSLASQPVRHPECRGPSALRLALRSDGMSAA